MLMNLLPARARRKSDPTGPICGHEAIAEHWAEDAGAILAGQFGITG